MENKESSMHDAYQKLDKQIISLYHKLISEIEDYKIYDGRGVFDLYECGKCGNSKFTTYAVKGVTPFCLPCGCGGYMEHTRSFNNVPPNIHVEKWVRPTFAEMEKLSDAQIEHVLKGGLLLESEILDNHISEKYDEFKEALNKMNARIAKSESIIIQRKCENQTWKRRNKNTKV